MDQVQVERIMENYRTAGLPRKERVILDFVTKLTLNPAAMEASDLEILRREGLSDRALLEVVHIAGYFNYINRVADALGVDPEPEWT